MKTAKQWAEELPIIIRIEFLDTFNLGIYQYKDLSGAIIGNLFVTETYSYDDFWDGVYDNTYFPTSADYLDENVPYTADEVHEMIIKYADPNDELCCKMLDNIGAFDGKKELPQVETPEIDALQSTIDGLNAIIRTQKLDIEQQNERLKIKDNTIEALQSRITELEQPVAEAPKEDLIKTKGYTLRILKESKQSDKSSWREFIKWILG